MEFSYDTGSTVDIIVNCTVGTNYEFQTDSNDNYDGVASFRLVSGAMYLGDGIGGESQKITGVGTELDTTYTYNVYVAEKDGGDITTLTGAFSITIPATLTVL